MAMTLPQVLLDLAKRSKKETLNIMMRTAVDVLKIWMVKAYGLKVGVIAVPHPMGKSSSVHTRMTMSRVGWMEREGSPS